MNNIKALGIANDGNMKRLAINYDIINDEGKVISSNKRVNRVVTDEEVINAINLIYDYSEKLLIED